MEPQDLDTLFSRLRESTPATPDRLFQGIQLRLGPPAASLKRVTRFAIAAGITSLLLAVWMGYSASHRPPEIAPPALGMFTGDISPFAAL
ncbi:MAG: hypothetical protein KA250_11675 [Verrucomicrobiales bacterium]|jgi:hypothetical protein|nr:hypothetical protein [Verrucomicrobiales bacterium]HQZ27762.1 hypothetical protein [Verrucomicrobiales bacterium]